MSSTSWAAAPLGLLIMLSAGLVAAAETFPLSCFYSAVDNEEGLSEYPKCARRDGEHWRISPEHLRRLSFDTEGLAGVHIDGASFYINPQGIALKVLTYDNGPDYFAEGLVRGWVGERVGYFDKDFRQVIPALYDWGTPFENGKADVCNGCRRGPTGEDGHWSMQGGTWGTIDRQGRVLEPLR